MDQPSVRLSRRFVTMAGASALLLPGAAWPQDTQREVEGGIGGTGIVGLLTDFGSLIVCGHHIETNNRTQITTPFGAMQESDLRLGMSLTVEASGELSALQARRVHVSYPLVGVIQSISSDGRSLQINGTQVRLPRRANRFRVGDRVAVSGVWRGAEVQASLLQAARRVPDYVSGDIVRAGGVTRIGSIDVRGQGVRTARVGSFGAAIGTFDTAAQQFVVREFSNSRFEGAAGPLRRLSVEGYLARIPRAPGYRIEGLGHSFARNLQLAQFADDRVLFDGLYSGAFEATSAMKLPENASQRRRMLKQLSSRRSW